MTLTLILTLPAARRFAACALLGGLLLLLPPPSTAALDASSPAISAFAASIDALWDYGNPLASETRFRRALTDWPEGSPQALEILTQVARAQGLQRRYAAAHATLDSVAASLDGMPSHQRVRYLLERGRVFNSSGSPAQAVPLFALALELAECGGDAFYAIDAAHMLGIAAPAPDRMAWHFAALALAKTARDPRAARWLGPVYNNLAWAYLDAGDAPRALVFFRKALPAWEARGDADAARVARWSIARALRGVGDLDAAVRLQRGLLEENVRHGTVDGFVFEELAEIAHARGDPLEARSWFAKAWRILRTDPAVAAEPERLHRMARLGGIGALAATAQ